MNDESEIRPVVDVDDLAAEAWAPGTVRFGITLPAGDYRRLHGIALARWRRRVKHLVLPDGAVSELIAHMIQRALDDVERGDEEREVRAANARHVAAVLEPWPTGPWSQDEVDQAVAEAHAGHTLDAIALSVRRQRAEVVELLNGFGLRVPRELRRRPAADGDGSSVQAVAR